MTIREQAMEAAAAARKLAAVSPAIKNKALEAMADALLAGNRKGFWRPMQKIWKPAKRKI